jgi:hypothetical protein
MRKHLLSTIFILFAAAVVAQDKIDLKLNLDKNTTYRFKSVTEQTVKQTINGIEQHTDVNSSTTVSIKMAEALPEFMIVEFRFDSIVTMTNAMGVNSNFTSASEGSITSDNMADVLSCILNRLSKNALYVKMDYAGKVIDIINAKMLSDIILKDTGAITGPQAQTIKAQIQGMAGNEALQSMAESFTNYLPARQVATGEKWEIFTVLHAGGMSLDIITRYVLNETRVDVKITAEANIKASENAGPMEYGGATIKYGGITGISKSTMMLDPRTCLMIESTAKSHITGDLDVTAQGFNMVIPMEINNTSTMVVLK